jgi:hypothetical protein
MRRLRNIRYFSVLFYYWAQYQLTKADEDHCLV